MNIFVTELSFRNLLLGEQGGKFVAQQIVPAYRTSYFSSVTEHKSIVRNYNFSGPIGIYLFEFSNYISRTKSEICSKLTIETPERRQ